MTHTSTLLIFNPPIFQVEPDNSRGMLLSYDHRKEEIDPDIASIMHMWLLLRCSDHDAMYGASKDFHQLFSFQMHTTLDEREDRHICYNRELAQRCPATQSLSSRRQKKMISKCLRDVCNKVFENRVKVHEGEAWEYNLLSMVPDNHIRAIFLWEKTCTKNKASIDVTIKYSSETDSATASIVVYSCNAQGFSKSMQRMMSSFLLPGDSDETD